MQCMANVLTQGGYEFARQKACLTLPSGLVLQPRFVSLQPLDNGGVSTVTTVEVSHSTSIPGGVFEFQHSTGASTEESLVQGFASWMNLDLPVLLDSLQTTPKHCTLINFDFPPRDGSPARKRRVVLGPVSHLVSVPAEPGKEAHPFCPCCLFTATAEVVKPKVSEDGFYAIRFFAARGSDGAPAADCRINGEDWDDGRLALLRYVESWPNRGVEFRKQYVVVQQPPAP